MDPSGPFVLRLADLNEGESRRELVGDAADLDIAPDQADLQGPVVVRATFYRVGPRIEVQGRIVGQVATSCGRCLAPLLVKLEAPLRAFLERRQSRDHRLEEEVREDDVGIVYHDGQTADLTDEVRQVLLLEVPWHALCREECRGLCPTCGIDRNELECSCEPHPSDHRWEALRKLSENP